MFKSCTCIMDLHVMVTYLGASYFQGALFP
jgi:hypothetical protein